MATKAKPKTKNMPPWMKGDMMMDEKEAPKKKPAKGKKMPMKKGEKGC